MTEEKMKSMMECRNGWLNLLINLNKSLNKIDPDYEIQQIKEKFGTLRFYATCSKPEVKDTFFMLIDNAEMASSKICEGCGSFDVVEQPEEVHWIKTYCKKCWDERINRKTR